MELVQLLMGGLTQGCVYGLLALGLVLIFKATEQVNFAQGDLMVWGGPFGLHLNQYFGITPLAGVFYFSFFVWVFWDLYSRGWC